MKNSKNKHKNKRNTNYVSLVCFFICIFMIVIIILYGIKKNDNYELLKENSTLDYVYISEYDFNEVRKSEVAIPYLNINSSAANDINAKIKSDYEITKSKLGYNYEYKYYVSDDIVSIVVQTVCTEEGNSLNETYEYFVYNYDLKENKEISDDELLEKYDITLDQVDMFLKNKFLNYYFLLVDKKKIDQDRVAFVDFLAVKNIKEMTDRINFAVEDNSLIAYRPFDITPINNDDKYFDTDNFRFVVVDKS